MFSQQVMHGATTKRPRSLTPDTKTAAAVPRAPQPRAGVEAARDKHLLARRRPTRRPKAISPKTRRYISESLEPRKYLVVLHAGDVFEFWADNNHMERVIVQGNPGSTTIELIGLRTDNFVGLAPGQTPVLDGMNGQVFAGPDAGVVGLLELTLRTAFQNGERVRRTARTSLRSPTTSTPFTSANPIYRRASRLRAYRPLPPPTARCSPTREARL